MTAATASPSRFSQQTPGTGPRSTTTPAARSAPPPPPSVGQAMPPLLSPRRSPPAHSGARTPSPNYFGFAAMDESFDSDTNSNQHTRKNWSPPSSAVRSTAAFSPTVIPVDQNPEFDAFRRQSEGKVFNLGNLNTFKQPPPPSSRSTHGRTLSRPADNEAMNAPPPPKPTNPSSHRPTLSSTLDPNSMFSGRSPKRHLSNDSTTFPDALRRVSPPSMGGDSAVDSTGMGLPRLSLPPIIMKQPPVGRSKARAETVPSSTPSDAGQSPLVTPQYVLNLIESSPDEILILDLRVSTQYARSRILGALSLCIPTTLLKRPSFNVQKLAETFQEGSDERARFENWKRSKHIIVYDTSSSQLKDATTCLNTIKKFQVEGYDGTLHIIKGGFVEFASKFPNYVGNASQSNPGASPRPTLLDGPEVAPVVGGCPMPATKSAANPFFGNIRQNMDLIGGVGQMPIQVPASKSRHPEEHFPTWLRDAAEENDKGARVSDKFLQIEKREQKRMQEALSGNVSYGSPSNSAPNTVQIAGIEKGTKNRYNNIWPYEHTRVKLQGVPDYGCDYVNANHISSKRSHKKYIATQGPIPATFADFWNVVWQQDVRVIVMLTAEKEGGQIKAHNYWNGKQFGPLKLEFLSEKRASLDPAKIKRHRQRPPVNGRKSTDGAPLSRLDTATASDSAAADQPFVIVRKLALSHEGFPFERMREVTQLQYSSWPDFGAPAHPAHLLGLVEQCDAVVRRTTATHHSDPDPPESRPIIVHCSAGCGRTGTFCTVDTVIDMLKRQRMSHRMSRQRGTSPMQVDRRQSQVQHDGSPFFKSSAPSPTSSDNVDGDWVKRDDQDLIEKTVEDFRHQRLSMVQSLRQFVLCYESVMEWLVEQEEDD